MSELPLPTPVTVMIFTLNEELHLPHCLRSLRWCDDIIVIDSFSTDTTERICREHHVRFVQHEFTGFGSQRNWALDNVPTKYPWILMLDADERVPEALAVEMGRRVTAADVDTGAFRVRRRFHMWGRWLRYSSLYPSWVVRLIHRERVRYVDRGHAETQTVDGRTEALANDLIDENLKGIDEWFERQNRYSRREADHELREATTSSSWLALLSSDPLRRRAVLRRLPAHLPCRAALYFFYTYVVRGGFLDGRDGFMFCRMKSVYQNMIVVKKYDAARRMAR